MHYVISETSDGRFIVQRPNGYGGLYPMIGYADNERNTAEIFRRIHEEWTNHYEEISIEIRFQGNPANEFTGGKV